MNAEITKLKNQLTNCDDDKKHFILLEIAEQFRNISLKKSRDYINQSIAVACKVGDKKNLASSYFQLSTVLIDESNYQSALENIITAQKLFLDIKDDEGIAKCLRLNGIIYGQTSDYKKALNFSQQALEKESKLQPENKTNIAGILNNIGIIYKDMRQYEKALEYHLKALQIRREIGKERGLAFSYNNIGVVYEFMHKTEKALYYYLKSYKIKKKLNDVLGLANTCLNIGNQLIELASYKKAEKYLCRGLETVEKLGSKLRIIDFHFALFRLFYKQQKYKEAIEHHIEYTRLKDKTFNNKLKRKIAEMQHKFDFETQKKEAEIYRLKNIELKNANASKDKFFSIIAHDLKSPFSSIISFVNLVKNSFDRYRKKELLSLVGELETTTINTFNLLENLLEWSRMQSGVIEFKPGLFNLTEIIKSVIEIKSQKAKEKEIELRFNREEDLITYGDKNMIETVLRNLINNAIKFTHSKGTIKVKASKKDGKIGVSIKDNGIGIKPEHLGKLFNIESNFSTFGTANEKGTGLGLILVNEFIRKNKGKITVKSEIGKGSNFTFYLPSEPEKE